MRGELKNCLGKTENMTAIKRNRKQWTMNLNTRQKPTNVGRIALERKAGQFNSGSVA